MCFCKKNILLFLLTVFYFQIVRAADISVDTTINSDIDEQVTLTVNNLTLINNATIEDTETSVSVQSADNLSGVTIINNVGGVIKQSGSLNSTIKAERNTNFTLINSGTISSDESNGGQAISIKLTTNAVITNNAGGIITTKKMQSDVQDHAQTPPSIIPAQYSQKKKG